MLGTYDHNGNDKFLRGRQLIHVLKEIKTIENNSNLNKTTKFIIDESDISEFIMIIKPNEGFYKDIDINFKLTVPLEYPKPGSQIKPVCATVIYHPNIFEHGRICIQYDNIGNMESGFKETLENLVIAINYMFIHPNNYGYGVEMPESVKTTIIDNVNAYRTRLKGVSFPKINSEVKGVCFPKTNSDILYKTKEIYDKNVNITLQKYNDWQEYIPRSALIDKKTERYYMLTLGGCKIMNIAKFEDVMSQIIRDPRFIFYNISDIKTMDSTKTSKDLLTPPTPFSIILSKYKRILYPKDILWDDILKAYKCNISFNNLLSNDNKHVDINNIKCKLINVFCNVSIKSNYKFSFNCIDIKNKCIISPILTSTLCNDNDNGNNSDQIYIMKFDQYIDIMMSFDNYLLIHTDNIITSPPWLYMNCSVMTFGNDVSNLLTNIAYKINTDDTSPYLKFIHTSDLSSHNRLLTNIELKLISEDNQFKQFNQNNQNKEINETNDYFDLELASKYLASTSRETGLDLSGIKYIR